MVGQSLTLNGRVIDGRAVDVQWVHTTSTDGLNVSDAVFTTRYGCRVYHVFAAAVDRCDHKNHVYNIRFPSVTKLHAGLWYMESPRDTPPESKKITVVVLG